MRWKRPQQPDPNVTVEQGGGGGGQPGGFPFPMGGGGGRRGGGLGIGGGGIMLLILAFVLFKACAGGGGGGISGIPFPQNIPSVPGASASQTPASPELPATPGEDELVDFSTFVFTDVQGTWREQFTKSGQQYEPTRMRLFSGGTNTQCGPASSATGPFYCRLDQTVYLDLDFFRELSQRFGAPGDFAQAYVIAHEIAHHVQQITGISDAVDQKRQQSPDLGNELSIRLELQADCLAGVWAQSTYQRGMLEEGDIEEALNAAQAVGDDRIQSQVTGRIDPESWTHGSAEQRAKWLRLGFKSGNPDSCNTFSVESA